MTVFEQKVCSDKLTFLCSPMVKGIVVGWCAGLNYEQKVYVIDALINQICTSLAIKKEDIGNDKCST